MKNRQVINNPYILPDGRCSKCGYMIKFVEDDWIIIKNRLLKIHIQEGTVKIKCPECKQFLTFVSIN